MGFVLSDGLMPQQGTGLWLDLRQHSIHPKSAVEQLEIQIEATSFVDRILLSEAVFQNLIDVDDMYLTTSRILYQSSDDGAIFLSSSRGLSTPFGSVVSAPSDVATPVENPIHALQLISGGKWVLLEKADGGMDDQAESVRIDAVGDFLDIALSSSKMDNMQYVAQDSGLVLPTTGTAEEETNDFDLGGVAVACDTKSEVMKLASTLQLTQCGEITESGIMLERSADQPTPLPTAIVLPFALDSWQIATMVFGKDIY